MHKHAFLCLWRDRERRFRSYPLATGPTAFLACTVQHVCRVMVPSAHKTYLVVNDSHGS